MDQSLALEIMLAGENVILTGAAGSGKTHVLREFIGLAKKQGKHVSVTATTGLAATHLNGTTIHAWSGIGVLDRLPRKFADLIKKGRRDIIQKTDILIIDEISMLHDYRLDMVDAVARAVRDDRRPFGGLQIILCGDFFQLPPVSRSTTLTAGRADAREGSFVVSSNAWGELSPTVCYLNEQFRQDDDDYLDILNAIRASDIRRRHVEQLLVRRNVALNGDGEITELHTVNVDVDKINAARLKVLSGQEHTYDMATTGRASYVQSLKRSCLALEKLTLKTGALVMCVRNNPEKKYVNGSLGIIKGFDEDTDYPIVELKNGRKVIVSPETWELRDGDKKRAGLTQIPLRLAWAITVHKSQGMTLDGARVDLGKAFVEGMGYVALSRVRRLADLNLAGINRMALKVSDEALAIDKLLRAKSRQDSRKFAHLAELAKKRKSTPKRKVQSACGGTTSTWAERLEKMRGSYPNAYRPWQGSDDSKLKGLFNDGIGLKELTGLFGRHPGSIRARLRKHYGEDVSIPR